MIRKLKILFLINTINVIVVTNKIEKIDFCCIN